MSRLSNILRSVIMNEKGDSGVSFYCPGCKRMHIIKISGDKSWQYNNDPIKPTFNPSILVMGVLELTEDQYTSVLSGTKIEPIPFVCHSFVKDGVIDFLNDCTHEFAGQKIPIPPLLD